MITIRVIRFLVDDTLRIDRSVLQKENVIGMTTRRILFKYFSVYTIQYLHFNFKSLNFHHRNVYFLMIQASKDQRKPEVFARLHMVSDAVNFGLRHQTIYIA